MTERIQKITTVVIDHNEQQVLMDAVRPTADKSSCVALSQFVVVKPDLLAK